MAGCDNLYGNKKTIKFYFVSGATMSVSLIQEKIDEILKSLETKWTYTTITGDGWGINFSLVTHYEIEDYNT